MCTDLTCGWAAGFYEGEGNIASSSATLGLTIAQVNPEPLERFKALVGVGSIRATRNGRITVFRVYGMAAQRVAMFLYPQLSRRRQDQILRALISHAFRTVRDPRHCSHGHSYSVAGVYLNPSGQRECVRCRSDRRHGGPRPVRIRPTAISLHLGVREYVPGPQS
jgi:hypothetical protein